MYVFEIRFKIQLIREENNENTHCIWMVNLFKEFHGLHK